MSPDCREIRLRWLEHAAPAAAFDDDVSGHLVACAECSAFVRRGLQLQRAFEGLERLPVPEELPGRVVAACHAGYLQDRATAWLHTMGRVEPPRELDQKVLGLPPGLRAPQVLERLVDEELREPSKALARRFAGRLERLEAPAELDARVVAELARSRPELAPDAKERGQALKWAVASFLVIVSLAIGVWYGASDAQAAPSIAFRIERVQDASELDGMARALAGGLTGGWSEVRWEEPR
ncbi:MAG: hypothetical protein IPJ77_24550 [Planctomycetes bacterium]|nr:hypothetical protein [Planctomycetota bacterium]